MSKYNSLGQMLKAGDFTTLKDELKTMIENKTISELLKPRDSKHVTELDELLFYIPDFATNKDNKLHTNCIDVINICLENGAEVIPYMKNGENFYLKSFLIKDDNLNKEILESNLDNIKYKDGMGNNALIYAIMGDNVTAIERLITAYGFDCNERNILSENQTPLHFACGLEKKDSILKLVELGADLAIKDNKMQLPIDMIELAYDEDLQDEYSDEPEMINRSKELHKEISLLMKSKINNKVSKLKKTYR